MTLKFEIIGYCQKAIEILKYSSDFGGSFVDLKQYFCREYQEGFIFSTRFGANFFEEVLDRVKNGGYIINEDGKKLGFYDENFNKWLKNIYET